MERLKPANNDLPFACALALPVLAFMIGYLLNHGGNLHPTGFVQFDNVSYIAYARQYLDADRFHLQYANPFDADAAPVYFQPQTLFFALLLKIGVPAWWILIPFTLVCSILCFRLLIAIYDLLMPQSRFRVLNIWLLAWGGGLLVVAGAAAGLYLHGAGQMFDDVFMVDPEHGWWGLNLGRSLLFSCEAYYHALFLGCIYCLLKRSWAKALLLLFLLSLSHPFTGIELIGIVGAWCAVELLGNRKNVPLWFAGGVLCTLAFHLLYYLFYLDGFADHHSVSTQYALNWRLRFYRMLPAYGIVGALALASVYLASLKTFFSNRSNRLLACWFIVAFLLANHEMFMKARQPIHFTRGYIWTSLFLLGLPAWQVMQQQLRRRRKLIGLAAFVFLMFLDNALWLTDSIVSKATQPSSAYITSEQQEVLRVLDRESTNKTVVVSSDITVAYLSSVYTKGIPWYAHPYTTPFADHKKAAQENFFTHGIFDPGWLKRDMNFVITKRDTAASLALLTIPARQVLSTTHYTVLRYTP